MASGTKIASIQHAAYCFDMLLEQLTNVPSEFDWSNLPLGHAKMPVFVTWYKRSIRKKYDELRGCLGTFSQELPIKIGLKKYSIMSALNDKRFDPINLSEVAHLSCSISLLHSFIRAKSWNDWELGKNGITIHFTDGTNHRKTYNATYLPEVPGQQRWNKLVTIENLVSKAGFNGSASMVKNLSVTRYESCKYIMDWNEFRKYQKLNSIQINKQILKLINVENKYIKYGDDEEEEEEEEKISTSSSSSSSLLSLKSDKNNNLLQRSRSRTRSISSRSQSESSRTQTQSQSDEDNEYESDYETPSESESHSKYKYNKYRKQMTNNLNRSSDEDDDIDDDEDELNKGIKMKRADQMSFDDDDDEDEDEEEEEEEENDQFLIYNKNAHH